MSISEDWPEIRQRLRNREDAALDACPEGCELLGWVYLGTLQMNPVLSQEAFPVYRREMQDG